ncbi:hypothetical protein [Acinetobacter parvus]|uniref:hypothetical protein n=1 Tax=Acinetobacter parvus TaxID=134533 RepID=UPI003919D4C0
MTVNYEALGRYVASEEAIKELLLKQTQLAHQIDRLLTKTKNHYPATKIIRVIETALLVELSTELNHVHSNLMVAIDEINSYADDAKKPKIDLIS